MHVAVACGTYVFVYVFIIVNMIFVALVAFLAAVCPIKILGQLSSMAALIDYITVTLIVMLFRYTLADAERPFKCPAVFVVAPIALIASTYLLSKQIIGKEGELLLTGKIIIVWFIVMFFLYVIRISLFKAPVRH